MEPHNNSFGSKEFVFTLSPGKISKPVSGRRVKSPEKRKKKDNFVLSVMFKFASLTERKRVRERERKTEEERGEDRRRQEE